jgi:FkbM family methyltransferase
MEGYEPETVRVFNAVLKNGDHVVVCGAHQGYFVSTCSKLVGDGRVYGFEPEPTNFSILQKKCINLPNVELYNYALGKESETTKFYINSDNDGGHALWNPAENLSNIKTIENPQVIDVRVSTLDDFFDKKDVRLKLLMLDAEGSEYNIILGGMNTIVEMNVPYIICEINNFALYNCKSSQMTLRRYLKMYGYTGYLMTPDKLEDLPEYELDIKTVTGESVVFNILFSRRGTI